MRHRVRLVAQIHDGVRNTSGDVDKGEVTEFSVGAIEACCKLCGELEYESRAFASDLSETRVGHFCDFAFYSSADPRAARWLFVEKAHLTEELSLVQVSQHHLIAVFVFDHDFNRSVNDVIQNIGQITRMNHHSL